MSEIQDAIQLICEEKNISVESVLETIEAALAAAYRKEFGNKKQNIKVNYDLATNKMEIFDVKTVVEDMDLEELEKQREEFEAKKAAGEEVNEEGLKRFNPKTEIMLAEAKDLDKKAKIGQELKTELEVPKEFGRMAAQTAKQVIIQRLREAERETVFNEFKGREGEILTAIIQRREGRNVYCDINRAMVTLPSEEQIHNEQYNTGQRLKVILISVAQSAKGPEIVVSRAHPNLLRELFRMEVPEIAAGTVEIKAVARESGSRSKIAVMSHEDNIDPVGSCVGQRGTRVQTVINELGGEKIDIIEWSDNIEKFIANSLSPAKVASIKVDPENYMAKVSVKEDQLSLAIGRNGQNVRLAAKLSGWKINIEGAEGLIEQPVEAVVEKPAAEELVAEPEEKKE
jgi:N utilization substance protein A